MATPLNNPVETSVIPRPSITLSEPEIAETAIAVQNACNLAGVLAAWSGVRESLLPVLHDQGTAAFNGHWANVLFASKVAALTGAESPAAFGPAYQAAQNVRDTGTIEG